MNVTLFLSMTFAHLLGRIIGNGEIVYKIDGKFRGAIMHIELHFIYMFSVQSSPSALLCCPDVDR